MITGIYTNGELAREELPTHGGTRTHIKLISNFVINNDRIAEDRQGSQLMQEISSFPPTC